MCLILYENFVIMADSVLSPENAYLTRLKDLEDTLKDVDSKVAQIYVAVIGDEKFDQKGIITRLKQAETKIDDLTALKYKLMGAFVAGGFIWTIIWEAFKNVFTKS
jgi:hypothetical protein